MLVDAEKLLKLFNELTDINDKPGTLDFVVSNGKIKFGMSYSLFPSVIDLVWYQTMSALHTMVINLHCMVSLSVTGVATLTLNRTLIAILWLLKQGSFIGI